MAGVIALAILAATSVLGDITSASLRIQGVALEVETRSVTAGVDIPTTIQTKFGGRKNDAATAVEGLLAVGDLTGPGIDTPITLTTAPGHRFQIPGLSRTGDYLLQNIRLMNGSEFVAPAIPSVASITVSDLLKTSIKVRQLTPEELRARGIVLDGRNFQVFEYSLTFLVDGTLVEIPFPVAIDPTTHQIIPIERENPYSLAPVGQVQPPRWSPPDIVTFDLPVDEAGFGQVGQDSLERARPRKRPSIPAAIIIPNSLAVLHQFFAVIVVINNGAPSGSTARLENISATVKVPSALRTIKSAPAVAFGQAVPIVDKASGLTFLVAQANGEAEWTLEGLAPGTHTIDIEVRATLRENGQEDVPLRAVPRASVVVHDPRFNITFSHPDTVRKGIDYSTYTFVTNTSAVPQTVRLQNGVPSCEQTAGANVCRIGGADSDEVTLVAGEMRLIEYKLRPGVTGQVFATAGTVDSENIAAAVRLHMGVSESGIPLSPATLVMPHYAQFAGNDLVAANLQLLGLAYSLATAPVTQTTARFPRVIKTDVFYRAADVARAGQRMFIASDNADAKRDALANLTLDLLGNRVQLDEWDELRRREKSGRIAGAAVVRELNTAGLNGGTTVAQFVDRFAAITAHRNPFALALVHGAAGTTSRPYALSVRGTSGRRVDVPNEAASGWVRDLPFADLSTFNATSSEAGEVAVVGRWTEEVDFVVTPAAAGPFTVELIYPATADGAAMRARIELTGTAGQALRIPITRGATTVNALLPNGGIAGTAAGAPVALALLQIVAARQDLRLDPEGHKVSVLFNRPVAVQSGAVLRTKFSGRINFNRDGVAFNGDRPIFAAALQDGQQVVNLAFDHVLTTNAAYSINVSPLIDPSTTAEVTFPPVVPVIDNARPGGILFGKFLQGNNAPIAAGEVRLYTGHFRGCQSGLLDDEPPVDCNPYFESPQYALTTADGSFLFEYVPRDPIADAELTGGYRLLGVSANGRFTIVDGAVRLPGRVHFVNIQLLGRGAAEGVVRYDNGQRVAGAQVYVGSTMFNFGRSTTTAADGSFHVDDLPVGPLTLSATDTAGNIAYASAEVATPGQVVQKDVLIVRKPFPGTGTVSGMVRRSDTLRPVAGARVAVYSQGYGFNETFSDSSGRFEFQRVPAGFVSVLAAEWSVASQSAAVDFDLHAGETKETTLTLGVRTAEGNASITGEVLRENPLFPGDPSKYERVAGALVKLSGSPTITADASARFAFDAVPVAFSGRARIEAYDPATKRVGSALLPTLSASSPNSITIFIPANSYGKGLIRVRVVNALGSPVTGFRVIEAGFPPTPLVDVNGGVYELRDAPVGSAVEVWAVNGPPQYGDQFASGKVKVEVPGQVVSLTLRLPGQGSVRAKIRGDFDLIGDVNLSYLAWDEAEQGLQTKTVTTSTSEGGVAGFATFARVPSLQAYTVESTHPSHGYASQGGTLAYEGDLATHVLQMNRLSTLRGTVYAVDGATPIAGAALRLEDGRRDVGTVITQLDGTFTFHDVPANVAFRIVADATQDGIYRTGVAFGQTPVTGGPVNGVSIVLRRRGSVEGRVVYADYKRFDPQTPGSNLPDDTPNDPSDNAPVPLAKFWLRELDFPSRTFGSDADPLATDANGRFAVPNVFVGRLRASAWDSGNQELLGAWTGELTQEGETLSSVFISVGNGGTGSLTVSVVDPNQQALPVANAELRLFRAGGLFDLTSTDGAGFARIDQLPTGTYTASAYSKALGKSGVSSSFTIVRDATRDVRILLEFSGQVDGTLTDPEATPPGRGVAGAPITLTGIGYQSRASTDVAGAFSFAGVREGFFTLDAKDTSTNRRASSSRTLSAADPHPIFNLQLEPTDTLYVSAYLPNDTGGNSGVLAGPVAIEVFQRCGISIAACDFRRATEGNPIVMPQLLRNAPYIVTLREIGGAQQEMGTSASFPRGSASDPVKFVFPAYGDIEVTVLQAGVPAAGAKVTISGNHRNDTVFTDSSGKAFARGFRLGDVSAQARSVDGALSGSASGRLERQSVPARLSIDLGAYAGVSGLVEAEAGGPSVGTRVLATFPGRTLEMMTDSDGRYTFNGIPTQSGGAAVAVAMTYIGPDGVTIGARQSVTIDNASASRIVALSTVRLDATPPQLLGVVPADGSLSVSPDTTIRFEFSERLRADLINNSNLQLVAADGSGQVTASFDAPAVTANGTFMITMRPPPPPSGQRFPLKSNTLYRLIVSGSLEDLTGHRLPSPRGFTFTTSDYAEPRVIKVTPPVTVPLPQQTTLQFQFNEPIDPAPWQSGGGAVFRFFKLSAAGAAGQIVAEKSGRAFIDPASPVTLLFAPNDPIESESFYRVVFSGARDLQGNALAEQTFHFFSFDSTRPFVRLVSPVPDGLALVSGVEYSLAVDLRNGGANGTPAADVASVDYLRVDGPATETFLTTIRTAPFAYRFVAPEAPSGGIPLTLRARATDASGNVSDPATITWTVRPNAAPTDVAVTLTPASAYPGNSVNAAVAFQDEGTFATAQVTLRASRSDGSESTESKTAQVTRASVSAAWPSTSLAFALPPNLAAESTATFAATVSDVRGLSASANATLSLLRDRGNPSIQSITPAAEATFHLGNQYRVEAVVSDAETAVAEVAFNVDGQTFRIAAAQSSSGPTPATRLFATPAITVPAKNIDTRVTVSVTATDYQGNATTSGLDVIYIGVNDPAVPSGAWLCPIDRAALPASQTQLSVPLRVRATDDVAVTGVSFRVPGVADPIAATRVGTTDEYQATATIATSAASAPLVLTAIIRDADASHTVELPITLDVVPVDVVIDTTQAITNDNLASFTNKSVLVRSATGRLVPHVPVTMANLIVADGGRVESLGTTTSTEQRIDLTVTGRLSVDCASTIDVTAKGYLGGWGENPDGSHTRNESRSGRTAGNTTTGGATDGAGSHGGLGGAGTVTGSNLTYGAIENPTALGGGGAGSATCCSTPGGAGGGAMVLRGASDGRIVIAGSVRADGSGATGTYRGGAGGSIVLDAKQLIIGPNARITANGGPASGSDGVGTTGAAGGGGRIAVIAGERLDLATPLLQLQARGGAAGSNSSFLAGGAGTVFLRRPSQVRGELLVASSDTAGATAHVTRATPLGAAGDVLQFDRVEIGPYALARFDGSIAIGAAVDDANAIVKHATAALLLKNDRPSLTVTSLNPPQNGTIIQAAPLDITISAASAAGVATATVDLAAAPPVRVESFSTYPLTTTRPVTLTVPATAAPGPTELRVRVTDRADRFFDAPVLAYTLAENQAPQLVSFTATPDSLYAGGTIATAVSASDDVAVTKVSLTSTIGSGSPSPQTRTPNTRTTDQTFSVAIPRTTAGGTSVVLEAAIEDGFPSRAAVRQTKTVSILRDPQPPAITIVQPAANMLFNEGAGATFFLNTTVVDAEVGVKTVTVTVGGGASVPLEVQTSGAWTATLPVPNVDGAGIVPIAVVVTATDYEGNSASPSLTIRVQPLIDPNGPTIRWTCSTIGAMAPAGLPAKLRVFAKGATTANGVQSVAFFAAGSSVPIAATAVTGLADHYEATWTVPDLADGDTIPVRAVATSVAGNQADVSTLLTVVRSSLAPIAAATTIDASNAATYSGKTVIVQSGVVTVDGAHTFDRLIVLSGARITHPAGGDRRVNVTTTRGMFVACDAAIDVTGAGFGVDQTYAGATPPADDGGGSHIGRGGKKVNPVASTFGSVYRPQEAGGGGQGALTATGGGVIRLDTPSLMIEGGVRSNGVDGAINSRGGAGGSIWITAASLSGGGSVEANGGTAQHGIGGGGAIAIETTSSDVPWTLTARTGNSVTSNNMFGGAGTIYVRKASSTWGDITIDNAGRIGEGTDLPSLGRGIAQTGTADATLVTDRPSSIPPYFAGHWVEVTSPAGVSKGIWRVASATGVTVTLAPNASETISLQPGDRWFGLYRFDTLKLRSAKLISADRLAGTIDADAPSSILGNNAGAPVIDPAKISLLAQALGISLIGQAGAVTDPDPPITITATNTATGTTFTGTAAANGSFAIGVRGSAGDRITVKARDGNFFPLESAAVDAGTLTTGSPTMTQLNKTAWTTDTTFKPQTLAVEGTLLATTSANVNGTSSNLMVVFDTTDAANPTRIRTVQAGAGAIRDFELVDGWAYVASDRLTTLDLRSSTSTMVQAADQSGAEQAVAVSGGYAFTSTAYFSDGSVSVYDVTNPAAPRFLSSAATGGADNTIYTDLIAYGASYLIGISDGSSGRDVTVIDRRETTNLVRVGQLQIATFIAWRGRMAGSRLYLASSATPEIVVVNLANPAAPVVEARLTLTTGAGQLALVGDTLFIADRTAGLLSSSSDPTRLAIDGAVTTGGSAYDVVMAVRTLYVANELGVAVIPVPLPPLVDTRRVTLTLNGTMGSITGAARALTGEGTLSAEIKNATTAASITVTPAADGSFSVSLPASPGDAMTVKGTDSAGRTSGPVSVGSVPFASAGRQFLAINVAGEDFRARTVKVEGALAVVSSYPVVGTSFPFATSGSNKLVTYDITNPSAPVQTRIVQGGSGNIRDFELVGGWAYVAADRLSTIDLRSSTSVLNLAADRSGNEQAVAVSGGYAFTSENFFGEGWIGIYDVSNPAAPRYLQTKATAALDNTVYSDLLINGSDYLIGLSNGTSGRDVTIIDRRDINNLTRVADLSIAQIVAFRGRLIGSTLYIAGQDGGVAVLDVSTPSAPQLVSVVNTPGMAYGIDAAGSTAVAADRSPGLAFFEVAPSLRLVGNQFIGGDAWDVAFGGANLYIANEQGLMVLPSVAAPPRITPSLVSVSMTGAVTGQPGAIAGLAPLVSEVRNATTGASVGSVAVASNGSFTSSITAAAGDIITVKATDAGGRVAGPVMIGSIPFGSGTRTIASFVTGEDFRARTLRIEGNLVVAGSYPAGANGSNKLLVHDAGNPTAPLQTRTAASGNVRDFKLSGGWAFVVAERFSSIDLTNSASTLNLAPDRSGFEQAICLADGYAFTSESFFSDGHLNVYDINVPSAPRFLSSQGTASADNTIYTDLLLYGTDYLIGLSDGTSGRDVVVIDRRDINKLTRVAELTIPEITAFRGRVVGTKLYIAGREGGVALVNLAVPTSPQVVSIVNTAGMAFGVDVTGTTAFVADRSPGVAVFDTSTGTLRQTGTQFVGGDAWDVVRRGADLYVANEQGIVVIENIAAPPDVQASAIAVSTSATVTGANGAVGGQAPLQVVVKNDSTAVAAAPVTASSSGAFTQTVTARRGERLSVSVTDAATRTNTAPIGSVPFATVTANLRATSDTDTNLYGRRVASDGTYTVVTGGTLSGPTLTNSSRALLFRQPDASEPPTLNTTIDTAVGAINDLEIRNGYAYIAANRLATINLTTPATTLANIDPNTAAEVAVALLGNNAFTAESLTNGALHIYDVTNPGAPVFVRTQVVSSGGGTYRDLIPYGTRYLIAISPDGNRDVTIIDANNVSSLVRLVELSIPNFVAFSGALDGTTLYVTGGDAGVAIVDVTNPATPVLRAVIDTPGIARRVAIVNANEIVVADASGRGLTFLDTSNRQNPIVLGSQPLTGNAADVKVVGDRIYVVTESRFMVLRQ